MATFQITSSAGVDMGTYEADTAAEALDTMARDAGYASQADAPVAFDGKVVEVRRFAVWGVGESTSAIVRSGEYDDAAIHASNARGWGAIDIATARESDAWYVVVTCDPDALDEQTRFDNSVAGYCEIDAAGKMVHDEGGPDVEVSEASAEPALIEITDGPETMDGYRADLAADWQTYLDAAISALHPDAEVRIIWSADATRIHARAFVAGDERGASAASVALREAVQSQCEDAWEQWCLTVGGAS